eukprot:13134-Heterococcus_DN1.PRE.3
MIHTCLLIASAAAFTSGIGVKLSAAGSLPPIVTPTLPCSTVLLFVVDVAVCTCKYSIYIIYEWGSSAY